MRVLMVHTRYQIRAGEDEVFEAERELLEDHGVAVETFEDDNHRLDGMGALHAAMTTVWSRDAYSRVRALLARQKFDVVHVHNTFPLLSPAVLHAAAAAGVPVVQTLHNFRLFCVSAIFHRDGHVCEDCLGRAPLAGLRHGCYRGSRSASAAVAAMIMAHRALGTWRNKVDRFIALSEFGRRKFIEGGIDPDKIAVKPNFVDIPEGPGDGAGGYALFVGRLTVEKGVPTLLAAWSRLEIDLPLKIVGTGPLESMAAEASDGNPRIAFLGRRPHAEVLDLCRDAAFLAFPSEWYEGFPRVLVEALACGTPVLAAAMGAAAEIVEPDVTGRHFTPGDVDDLAEGAAWLARHTEALDDMRRRARATYERRYTPEVNFQQLMKIYEAAIHDRG